MKARDQEKSRFMICCLKLLVILDKPKYGGAVGCSTRVIQQFKWKKVTLTGITIDQV